MTTRRGASASKPVSRPKASRPAPTRVSRPQIAPHVKTLSNGQPRPKRRSR